MTLTLAEGLVDHSTRTKPSVRTEDELRLNEAPLRTLLQLSQMGEASEREITDFALEGAVNMTGSTVGYLALMNKDETVLTMYSWSRTAMKHCAIVDKPIVYPVEKTGLWGEAVRQRRPVITNDYAAPNPLKKGCPEGHVPILRHMNVPVFDGGRIVVVAGVANKQSDYTEQDAVQLTLMMDGMWRILERRRMEEELKRNLKRQTRLNRLMQQELPARHGLAAKLQGITDAVVEAFDADFCRIWVTAPGDRCESGCVHAGVTDGPHVCVERDRCLHLMASSGRYTHLDGEVHRRVPFGCYKIGRVAAGRDGKFITNDVQNDPRVHQPEWARELGLTSFAGYRLTASNGTPFGVLALFAKHSILDEDDQVLNTVAATTSHVIQAVRAEESLRSVLDELESRVQHRTEELAKTNGELEARIAEHKRTEEALRASEDKFAKAFLLSPCAVTLTDLDTGVFLEINESITRLLGYTRDELIGTSSLALGIWVHPEDRAEIRRLLDRFGAVRGREVQLRTKSGESRWVSFSAAIVELKGTPRLLGSWEDITERRIAASRIEAMHKELQDLSRQAGMAEIASGVLHNVGNVLNSVNVSTEVITEKLRRSKLAGLAKASGLMQEHASELGTFMTADAKGKQLPTYLASLAEHLREEQDAMAEELKTLADNVEHIKTIVSMQQAYATASSVLEPVMVEKLIDDALRINAMAFTRHQIEIAREYTRTPPLMCDRQKLLQILINLIRNAKHALHDGREAPKRLTVRVWLAGENRVRIQIEDNGCGITQENMSQIFRYGFTTKKDGHGFGLHNSALTAKQMGGVLTANSDGAGLGATFTLELPLEAPSAVR